MKTIQERLRAAAAVYNRDERPSDTYMLQAADEIGRLLAALKASDEALLDVQHAATHLMPWTTHQAIRDAQSRAAARSRKEPQS